MAPCSHPTTHKPQPKHFFSIILATSVISIAPKWHLSKQVSHATQSSSLIKATYLLFSKRFSIGIFAALAERKNSQQSLQQLQFTVTPFPEIAAVLGQVWVSPSSSILSTSSRASSKDDSLPDSPCNNIFCSSSELYAMPSFKFVCIIAAIPCKMRYVPA